MVCFLRVVFLNLLENNQLVFYSFFSYSDLIIDGNTCSRPTFKMVLKISHSPCTHTLPNPWDGDYEYDSFHTHGYIVLHYVAQWILR